jgi:hypothetical protein
MVTVQTAQPFFLFLPSLARDICGMNLQLRRCNGRSGGRCAECAFHGPDEIRFPEWLPEHHRVPSCPVCTTPADEQVRNWPSAEDRLHGRDAGSAGQARIDDHQVGTVLAGSQDGAGLGGLDGAYAVTHLRKHLGKQVAHHGVVLHDEDAERFHRFTSRTAPPSSIRSIDLV